ncbi:MAG: shikimate dehydrogenase [Eubacteriales bacterium]|nr:shikimate dehydrogenase [Eubacteriales bacterium]
MENVILSNCLLKEYKNVKAKNYIGIFGNPIKHTLSPVIHDTLSEIFGLDEKYLPFEVSSEDLSLCVKAAYDTGMLGLNITVPYKQDVMDYLVEVDSDAKAIGAVNTLVRSQGGFIGYNTDMPGLARAVFSEGVQIKGSKVIMLGAGGAARAVLFMCLKYGAEKVYIVNRTLKKADMLAKDMNTIFDCDKVIPIAADAYREIPRDSYLMLQCTSVGLKPEDGLPLITDTSFYSMASCGVDLIYNPSETPFLKVLKSMGIQCFHGLKMLLYQGIMAYELWNHVSVSEEQAKIVYRKLCERLYGQKIILIGYMGTGKTTVGKEIAKRYGYEFLDTDAAIEEENGMKISQIFAEHGEEYFRNLETDFIKRLAEKQGNYVISTGGGLPLRAENRSLLKELGTVYYLQASADIIYDRLKGDTSRPLLDCEDPYAKICKMLAVRDPYYALAGDINVDVSGKTPAQIALEIMSK